MAATAAIPDANGVIHGCRNTKTGVLRVIDTDKGQTCSKDETALSWNQTGPQGPAGSVLPGTIYDAISMTGSYQHDQGAPDKIVNCPDGRVAISGWAFAGNDIPLPVIINNSAQFTPYIEIHVAGSGSGPWPASPGQLAQGESVFYGMICARVST